VKKTREIIRYCMTTSLSARQVARALGISRTVVATTIAPPEEREVGSEKDAHGRHILYACIVYRTRKGKG